MRRFVAGPDDDVEALKAEVMEDMKDIFSSVDKSGAHACRPQAFGLSPRLNPCSDFRQVACDHQILLPPTGECKRSVIACLWVGSLTARCGADGAGG